MEVGLAELVAKVVFLFLQTPMGTGGIADLTAVESGITEVCNTLLAGCVVVNNPRSPSERPHARLSCSTLLADATSAEMIKYAADFLPRRSPH